MYWGMGNRTLILTLGISLEQSRILRFKTKQIIGSSNRVLASLTMLAIFHCSVIFKNELVLPSED